MVKDYPPPSELSVAFAREYKAFMLASGIRGNQVAERLGRNESYVSVRVNGKRPLDTDDIDALAVLAGWNGTDLFIELARRAQAAVSSGVGSETAQSNVIPLRQHGTPADDDGLRRVAYQDTPDEGIEH